MKCEGKKAFERIALQGLYQAGCVLEGLRRALGSLTPSVNELLDNKSYLFFQLGHELLKIRLLCLCQNYLLSQPNSRLKKEHEVLEDS